MNIRFAHISDTHVMCDQNQSTLTRDREMVGDPVPKLVAILASIRERQVDFILVTGDLIHEGDVADYHYFQELFREHVPGIPYVVTLGNHDTKKQFFEAFYGEAVDKRYDEVTIIGGLSIISLDVGEEKASKGYITDEQVDWMYQVLDNEESKGIIAFHQPLVCSLKNIETKVVDRFNELLKEGKILGVFCGHTHIPQITTYQGVPHIVAPGIGFGVDVKGGDVLMTNYTGYHLCEIEGERLSVEQVSVWPMPNKSRHVLIPRGGKLV